MRPRAWAWVVILAALAVLGGGPGALAAAEQAEGQGPRAVYMSVSGKRMVAVFDNKAGTVTVTLPGKQEITLPQALSASGARYSNGTETFWEHHGEGSFYEGENLIFQGKVRD